MLINMWVMTSKQETDNYLQLYSYHKHIIIMSCVHNLVQVHADHEVISLTTMQEILVKQDP